MKKILVIILISMLFSSSILFGIINQYAEENIDEQNILAYNKRSEPVSDPGDLGDSWPMFGHNPKHTRYSSYLAPEIKILQWTFTTGNQVRSSPAVVDGKVYIGSDDNKTYCLDAKTGAEIWNFTTGGEVRSSPAVVDGKVYVGSNDGKIYCLDAENGTYLWNRTTNGAVYSSPTVTDGKVYIGSDDNFTYCFDADTGITHWGYLTGGYVRSSPAIANGKVYVGSLDGMIYCLDADVDGTGDTDLIWSNTTSGLFLFASPAIYNDKIYITNYYDYGKTHCFDTESGEEIWNISIRGRSSLAIADGKVYIGSKFFGIYCLNAENGSEIWNEEIDGIIYESSPAVADGKLYIGTSSNTMYCLDIEYGQEIWSYQTGGPIWSSPAIADGKVYFGSYDNKVYCIGNEAPETPDKPDGSTDGLVGVEYSYTTNEANDPDGHEVLYLFDWGDGETSGWITLPSARHSWDTEGTYWIKVKAKDIYDAESEWSNPSPVSIAEPTQEEPKEQQFIFGIVLDESATPIEGARVCAIINETNNKCKITGDQGEYYISVPTGTYTVVASKDGYYTSTQYDIVVEAKQAIQTDFVLSEIVEEEQEVIGDVNKQIMQAAISAAREDNKLGAEINIQQTTQEITTYRDIEVEFLEQTKDTLKFNIAGEGSGTIIVISIHETQLSDIDNIDVTYDGIPIEMGNIASIFNLEGDTPYYGILITRNEAGDLELNVILYSPHFSEHSITITSVIEAIVGPTAILLYVVIAMIAAIVFLGRFYLRPVYLAFFRRRR